MVDVYVKLFIFVHDFYKHIRIQGLGSDMLKTTQNID